MLASQIRQKARDALAGKWGKAALLTLSYVVLLFIIEWVLGLISVLIPVLSFLVSITLFVMNIPIVFGLTAVFMKLKRGEDVGYAEFLSIAFSNIGNAWKVAGNIVLKILPLMIGIIVSIVLLSFGVTGSIVSSRILSSFSSVTSSGFGLLGVIGFIGYIVCIILLIPKSFSYALSYYILFDNPSMTGKQIVEESERLMNGNRWKLLCLSFSFIGWAILATFTFYIGYFWLIPYMAVATVCFYETLSDNTVVETTKIEDNNNDSIQGE